MTASMSGERDERGALGRARDVAIAADGVVLQGVLELPEGASADSPAPGVVLVHGSGPHSRNPRYSGQLNMAFGFDVPVFQQLAQRLRDAGLAVLRYDKRTCGPFNGCADNGYPEPSAELTIDVFVDDVRAAVDHLAALPEVDAERVFLIGHSQGAKLGLDLMAGDARVRAAVMLSANHRALDALLEYQVEFARQQLLASGLAAERVDEALAPARMLRDRAAAARRVPTPPGQLFLASWLALDDRAPALARDLDRPVLALAGDYDWNVPPAEIDAWRTTFEASTGDPGHEVALIACVTHALNCIDQPDPARIEPADLGRDLHPPVTDRIVAFLNAH